MRTLDLALPVLDCEVAFHGLPGPAAAVLRQLWSPLGDPSARHEPVARRRIDVEVAASPGTCTGSVEGRFWRSDGPDAAVVSGCAAVNNEVLTRTAYLALHAAVVRRGSTVVTVPAASGVGKSTLACALVARGWQYVSDEALVLSWDDGRVVPYPRPVSLSPWSWRAVGAEGRCRSWQADGEHLFDVTGLGPPATAADPAAGTAAPEVPLQPAGSVTHVLLPDRAPRPGLASEARAVALTELLHRNFTLHRDPARGHALLGDVVRGADVLRLQLAEPNQTADLVDAALR